MPQAASEASPVATTTAIARSSPVASLREAFAGHSAIFVLLAGYLAAALAIDSVIPDARILELRVYDRVFAVMLEAYTIGFLFLFVGRELRRVPSDRSALPWLWSRLCGEYLSLGRVAAFVLMVVYARVLTDTYMSLKAAIPLLQPFSWDETFMLWDRALHFGHDPWLLLQPFATPLATAVINFFYNLWIFVLFAVFIWQAWSANRSLRKRFFLTFGLSWMLLGTLGATVFSSAGPCYYGRVAASSGDPYAPLMSYLREVDRRYPVWALAVQESLWDAYADQDVHAAAGGSEAVPVVGKVTESGSLAGSEVPSRAESAALNDADASVKKMLNGISAMPSMHVAMSVLFALLAWNVGRGLGVAFTLFALIIQVGSVHLGWHYAIDGYASAAAVTLLWIAVGRFVGRDVRRRLTL